MFLMLLETVKCKLHVVASECASHDVFVIRDAAMNDIFDLILYYSHISSVSHQSILLAKVVPFH